VLEFEEIKQQVYFERTEGAKTYTDLLKPGILRRVCLGCSLQMWSQLTGISVMMWVTLRLFCVRGICLYVFRYYIIYVFQGAGLTGTRANLIADSVQYVLNVVFTVPAIIYIDRWGRRPMLLIGTLLMGFWLSLVGGLQGHFGDWGIVDGSRVWVINGHQAATKAIIVCSYLFVSSFAVTMGPVSWTVGFLHVWVCSLHSCSFMLVPSRDLSNEGPFQGCLPCHVGSTDFVLVGLFSHHASARQTGHLTLLSPGLYHPAYRLSHGR
jgi:hypothetical protein